ncbi:hypothetical protein PVW48_17120 [Dinoroseobacter sp. PD6]|uniref:hypothetical protein n=1 Tax=Dinoroseobacter sp. PD6 TaxID=3028384 RepID=UPI00237AF8B5|nr:hypothetical protein [Dinoroseobacter sp. PD6]MDD9718487.1 hypothetical protein [Dinoroseobacter sp. PD6]
MAALVWLLWPSDLTFVDNPEAWFVFGTCLIVWLLAEIKQSEELSSSSVTQNDIRNGREILKLHRGSLRYLLCDVDLWNFVDSDLYSEARSVCNRWDDDSLFFHNKALNEDLHKVVKSLDALSMKVAHDTVPEFVAGKMRTGYKPYHIVKEDEYELRRRESKKANELANQAWNDLDQLAKKIRDQMPQVLDEPL